jgi:parallel beta-helix repeat protein
MSVLRLGIVGLAVLLAGCDAVGITLPVSSVHSTSALNSRIQNAAPGDVITIAPGTYLVTHTIGVSRRGSSDHPITVRAEVPGTVLLESRIAELFKVVGSNWTFENLDISGVCADDTECEHAFHIAGNADHIILRNNRIFDFNAHIKANGEGGHFPNDVVIEGNALFATHYRATESPVAFIDVVGGQRWIVRHNFFADIGKNVNHPPKITDDWGYAIFLKGNSSHGLIENNIVDCAASLPPAPAPTRGISLGGSSTDPNLCEGSCAAAEHRDGIVRNNLVLNCPADAGIYLYRATGTRVLNNTLYNTTGILATASATSATIADNLLSGSIAAKDGATIEVAQNQVADPTALDRLFVNPQLGDVSLRAGAAVASGAARSDVPDDLCDAARGGTGGSVGAVDYAAGSPCQSAAALIADYRRMLSAYHSRPDQKADATKP